MPIHGLELIDQLKLSADSYVILGSAAAIAHGMPKSNNDLDILVQNPIGVESVGILDIGTGLFDGNLSKEAIFADSCLIDGYRFMGLASLLEFYRTLSVKTGKQKHLDTLQWVQERVVGKP